MGNASLNAKAYVAITAMTLSGARRWKPLVLPGTVIPHSELEHPGIDIGRLIGIPAIRPATPEEAEAFDREFADAPEGVAAREADVEKLQRSLVGRMKKAGTDTDRAALLLELMAEWNSAEAECRRVWGSGPPAPWTEDEYFRHNIRKDRELKVLSGRSEALRDAIERVAEPLMVEAEGLNFPPEALERFVAMTKFQEVQPNLGVEWAAQQYVTRLRRKLLHRQKTERQAHWGLRGLRAGTSYLFGNLFRTFWSIAGAAGTAFVLAMIYSYLKSRGIDPKPFK